MCGCEMTAIRVDCMGEPGALVGKRWDPVGRGFGGRFAAPFRPEKMCRFRPRISAFRCVGVRISAFGGRRPCTGAPKSQLYDAGRFRLRIWVQNDRKKIRLHRKPAFWRGSVFYYPNDPFEWLTGGGAKIWCSIDVQPQISRFRGRDPPQNDRMVPNYPRIPVHVPACSARKLIWNVLFLFGRFVSLATLRASGASGFSFCVSLQRSGMSTGHISEISHHESEFLTLR